MSENVQQSPMSQETLDLLNRSALWVVGSLIYACRPVWPENESIEDRKEVISMCSVFVLDALGKVVQAHARDLVLAEQAEAVAADEKPVVTQ